MDLPIYYPFDEFKRTVCMNKQNPVHQRIAFQDFGCSGHVDVVFDKAASQPDMRIIPQRRQLSLQDRNHFCASLPTIPLRDTPVPVKFPLSDSVMEETLKLQKKLKDFAVSIKIRRSQCQSEALAA